MIKEEHLIPYETSALPEGPYLIFAPHPDDETFGMGGVIALASQAGIKSFVVVVTNGSEGGDPLIRLEETLKVKDVLGIEHVFFWDIPDRSVEEHGHIFEEKVPFLLELVNPGTIFLPSPFEIHPDHRASTFLCWKVLADRGFSGNIWLYEIVRQAEINRLIDITPVARQKSKAIEVYASQLQERAYGDIVWGINRARTLTLPGQVLYAEGFYELKAGESPYSLLGPFRKYAPEDACKNDAFPLVSIVVRTKDRPDLLREALASIAGQSYPAVEVVVVNDGGEDVEKVVYSFENSISKIQYINNTKNVGRAEVANIGLDRARGTWVGLLDDDDIFAEHGLETLMWYGRLGNVVYGRVELILLDPDGKSTTLGVFGREFSRNALFVNNYIPTCGLLFKKHIAVEVGGFDRDFGFLEDWDFIYRLAKKESFIYAPYKVAYYRSFHKQSFVVNVNYNRELPWRKKFYEKHIHNVTPQEISEGYFDFVYHQAEGTREVVHQWQNEVASYGNYIRELERKLSELSEKKHGEINQLHSEIKQLRDIQQDLRMQMAYLESEKASILREKIQMAHDLEMIRLSTSWRITAPLRHLSDCYRTWARNLSFYGHLGKKFISYSVNMGLPQAIDKTLEWVKRRSEKGLSSETIPISPKRAREILAGFQYKPLISIIMPVYNTKPHHLRACLNSIVNQYYDRWELCAVDDASNVRHVKDILEEYKSKYAEKVKVQYRDKNGHIAKASNDGFEMASGEFVAFVDHDDELVPEALLEVVQLLNEHPEADVIYSDEDKIWLDGSYKEPFYKPDWSPELILGEMYTCHLSVFRKSVVSDVGGMREGFEGAQDWDLILRVAELTDKIYHIPKILYHWRMHEDSTASSAENKGYASVASLRAVQEALERRKESAVVEMIQPGRHLVRFHLKDRPLVSIIIPTRDLYEDLDKGINSIFNKTDYDNYEIIVVDNRSSSKKTFDIFRKWHKLLADRFKVVKDREDFNFSRLVNLGASSAHGEVLLLLNNDVEIIEPESWLEEMLGYAQRKEIGCVSCVLLYPDNTIQHAGVILGIRPNPSCPGVAGHAFKYLPSDHPGYFDRLKVVSNYAAVTGACMMLRKEVWDEVNGFDEALGVAFNDVDFCLRLLGRGYRHVVLPHIKIYHHESKSRGYEDTVEKQSRFKREIEIMRSRWSLILDRDPYYNINLPINREDFGLARQ